VPGVGVLVLVSRTDSGAASFRRRQSAIVLPSLRGFGRFAVELVDQRADSFAVDYHEYEDAEGENQLCGLLVFVVKEEPDCRYVLGGILVHYHDGCVNAEVNHRNGQEIEHKAGGGNEQPDQGIPVESRCSRG